MDRPVSPAAVLGWSLLAAFFGAMFVVAGIEAEQDGRPFYLLGLVILAVASVPVMIGCAGIGVRMALKQVEWERRQG